MFLRNFLVANVSRHLFILARSSLRLTTLLNAKKHRSFINDETQHKSYNMYLHIINKMFCEELSYC